MPKVSIKRAYDPVSSHDGYRVLVDRLWPRGKTHHELRLHGWAKVLSPSTKLREWFGHQPDKWAEFKRRYYEELAGIKGVVDEMLRLCRSHKVTLIYAAHDREHNNAVALAEYLNKKL